MSLKILLEEKNLSVRQCSKQSNIPYSTLLDLVREKTDIRKCSADTVYKLAKTLNMSMEDVIEKSEYSKDRLMFETFKSSECHYLKNLGDLNYIVDALKNKRIDYYWDKKWYPEAYYVLAMVDYLSKFNDIPICKDYNHIRCTSLVEPMYPRDIELAASISPKLDRRQESINESIPEFIRFNIVEKDVRNVC